MKVWKVTVYLVLLCRKLKRLRTLAQKVSRKFGALRISHWIVTRYSHKVLRLALCQIRNRWCIRYSHTEELDSVRHDIILDIDFMRKWDIEIKNEQAQWRVGQTLLQDGDWHQFSNGMTSFVDIYTECADISAQVLVWVPSYPRYPRYFSNHETRRGCKNILELR